MTALLLAAAPAAPLLLLAAMALPRLRARAAGLAWAAPLPALASALWCAGAEPLVLHAPLRLLLVLDQPSALLLGGAALLWCAASVYARGYLPRGEQQRFAGWWLATMSGSLGVFVAGDLVSFYLAFALASLPAWGLVIHDRSARAWQAGATYMLLAVIGEAALLAAFALLAAQAPGATLAIAEVLPHLGTAPLRDATIGLLLVGFGIKAGLVPLHVWLPLAHPAAPMPASAVLSGAIIKAGVIGLLRFLPVEATPAAWGQALAVIGFVTAFWGVGVGITQRNPKTVLAYSSVSQMGVVSAAIGLGIAGGIAATPAAAAFYALHHMLAKGALFLAVGVAGARWLVVAPAVVLALGFGGLPPTGGWLAKEAVKDQLGGGLAGWLSVASAAGSTLLMLHFVRCLVAGGAREESAVRPDARVLAPWLAMAILALLLPWALAGSAGLAPAALLDPVTLLQAAWPVALGGLAAAVLARAVARLPAVPEGDVIILVRRALRRAAPLAPALMRIEAAPRGWCAAGLAVLAVALGLFAALLAAR